jgi:hypothetical protein
MIEHVKKLTEEAWRFSPEERIEFFRVLSAMVREDGYDSNAVATKSAANAWGAWLGSDRQLCRWRIGVRPMTLSSIEARSRQY